MTIDVLYVTYSTIDDRDVLLTEDQGSLFKRNFYERYECCIILEDSNGSRTIRTVFHTFSFLA